LELNLHLDVRELLPDVDAPTLVIHRTDDQAELIEDGRAMAAGIRNSTFIELPGADHFGFAGDMDGWMNPIEHWVAGSITPPKPDGSLAVVTIRTLGRFAVEKDGRELRTSVWGSRLARQLCKRLVAARGWPVTRDELMDMLWPGETDRATLSSRLSVQISKARRALGGGIVADRDAVRLNLDEVSTDLERFYRADDEATIVSMYTGSFLPEDIYEDWTAGPRDDARTRFVTAARALAQRSLQTGDQLRAIELARRLIETDPYDDHAHRLLIRSLAASNERGEAARAHTTWAETMAKIDIEVPPLQSVTT
jgi:DNA-binding SARP family transcriptional activator